MVSQRLLCRETTYPPCLQEMAWCPRGPIIIIIYHTADILVTNWDNGISAAFDVTVASPLNSSTITEAGMYSGAAARAAELRKHTQNDSKCAELSWKCIPLAVECYSAWGPEALKAFSQVATRFAIRENTSKSMALTDLFGRLSHSLIRANARAILSRSYSHLLQQVDEL